MNSLDNIVPLLIFMVARGTKAKLQNCNIYYSQRGPIFDKYFFAAIQRGRLVSEVRPF